jgi:hypothetical protein
MRVLQEGAQRTGQELRSLRVQTWPLKLMDPSHYRISAPAMSLDLYSAETILEKTANER